jgi:hypothetical protein
MKYGLKTSGRLNKIWYEWSVLPTDIAMNADDGQMKCILRIFITAADKVVLEGWLCGG